MGKKEKRDERRYFNNSMTYDDVLDQFRAGEYLFYYKKRAYLTTWHKGKYCITVIDEGEEAWYSNIVSYEDPKDFLDNHVFPDGVSMLDACASEDIDAY